jgi:hypothetical protein
MILLYNRAESAGFGNRQIWFELLALDAQCNIGNIYAL